MLSKVVPHPSQLHGVPRCGCGWFTAPVGPFRWKSGLLQSLAVTVQVMLQWTDLRIAAHIFFPDVTLVQTPRSWISELKDTCIWNLAKHFPTPLCRACAMRYPFNRTFSSNELCKLFFPILEWNLEQSLYFSNSLVVAHLFLGIKSPVSSSTNVSIWHPISWALDSETYRAGGETWFDSFLSPYLLTMPPDFSRTETEGKEEFDGGHKLDFTVGIFLVWLMAICSPFPLWGTQWAPQSTVSPSPTPTTDAPTCSFLMRMNPLLASWPLRLPPLSLAPNNLTQRPANLVCIGPGGESGSLWQYGIYFSYSALTLWWGQVSMAVFP